MEPLPMNHTSLDELDKDQPLCDIKRPHYNDVLCGRGVSTNRHPGNESFRSLVGLNKELYVTSTKRQKMSISRSIVEAVRTLNPPGRFLEKNVVDLETFLWFDIGDRKAIEKTSQALRDGAASLRKQLSQDLGDPDFLSAVFDMDSLATNIDDADKKKKKKPTTKKQAKKGPTHRRTKSNPDGLSSGKKKSFSRKVKSSDVAKQPPCPMSPPRSQPPSPGSRRYIWEVPVRAHSMSAMSSDHSAPSVPPPILRHREDIPMPILSTGSFESASPHYEYARHGPPPSMHWQYTPHRFGLGSPASPMSPTPSHVSSSHYDYTKHPPMSPGGMHLVPDYSQRPPMSPVMNISWSPHSSTYRQPPQLPLGSPHSLPDTDYPGWRSPMSPPRNGYGPRELSPVPVLNEPPRSPMLMSPVQSNMPLPPSPIEFRPPPSPIRKGPAVKKSRCSPSILTASSSKEKAGLVCLSAQACCESPTVVVHGVLDESRSDNMLKPEVEVILSQDTDERFEREMTLNYMQDNTGQYGSDAMQVSIDSDSFSPLPFDQDDDANTESLMQMTADLLQMPIAPCSPHDDICR